MFKEVPMLHFMTLTSVVKNLWSGYDFQNSKVENYCENDLAGKKWSIIEKEIERKIENFHLPNTVKIILSNLVKPIGNRIQNIFWRMYDGDYLPAHFMNIIHWTCFGTIDEKKTAEAVIEDEKLPISQRYEIACNFCLEDKIAILWNRLPKKKKKCYCKVSRSLHRIRFLPIYWAFSMKEEIDRLDRKIAECYHWRVHSCQFGFMYACVKTNKPALEHFIGKLSKNGEKSCLYLFCLYLKHVSNSNEYDDCEEYECDIIFYLFSLMDENQQTRILQKYTYFILKQFLEYPYRGLFLEFESNVQKYLTDNEKGDLSRLGKYNEDFNYFLFRKHGKN